MAGVGRIDRDSRRGQGAAPTGPALCTNAHVASCAPPHPASPPRRGREDKMTPHAGTPAAARNRAGARPRRGPGPPIVAPARWPERGPGRRERVLRLGASSIIANRSGRPPDCCEEALERLAEGLIVVNDEHDRFL